VVEDDEDMRGLVSWAVADSGADVTAVASAEEALAVIGDRQPDILVSDIRLPGDDGYVLLHKVKALLADRSGTIRAVALTAFATAADRKKALDAGYQAQVNKPVDPADLVALLAEVAGRGRS
jgi:CheY-like chemotaxis protein